MLTCHQPNNKEIRVFQELNFRTGFLMKPDGNNSLFISTRVKIKNAFSSREIRGPGAVLVPTCAGESQVCLQVQSWWWYLVSGGKSGVNAEDAQVLCAVATDGVAHKR